MKLPIINTADSDFGNDILKKYYADNMIPAEKKTYLTDLRHSVGPYMGLKASDGSTHYLLDAASQIATLGHGFNPAIFFGTSEFLESWTNDATTSTFKNIRHAYLNFFNRKLGWKKTYMTFTHSGAEANEVALGYAYRTRTHHSANKVLAFEGSFHGRMMVTLAATWNKSKREPFEWKNYLAEYVKYPELPDGQINVDFPTSWREIWSDAALKNFSTPLQWNQDPVAKKEVEILHSIREHLLSKKIFAILVEPMQCEGGDCYSSDRFHTALLLMAKTFKVPVIHDEVQTGFHLGREFFWHRQLNLLNLDGEPLNPDYVICAKKAQVGIVLAHHETKDIFPGEEFSVASALRGYAHAIGLDQCQNRIIALEKEVTPRVQLLIKKHSPFIKRMRVNGLAFAFDVADSATMNKFVGLRFKHGLLYYPAGDQTLRFRLSIAFGPKDLDFLFERLDAICLELFHGANTAPPTQVETDARPATEHYEWHEFLIQNKLNLTREKALDTKSIFAEINRLIEKSIDEDCELRLIEINASNFLTFRQEIIDLQKLVYEPARQTDIEKFEHTVLDQNSLCLGLVNQSKNNPGKKLQAIAFAGPLKLYPLERGLREDPYFNHPDSLYMLDLTVTPQLQKTGVGRALKCAILALATTKGVKRIQGRNRDRLAAAMININLSLGAVEQNYFREDYPDFEPHRDVFYYSIKTNWSRPEVHLSRGTTMPFSEASLNKKYIHDQLPFLVNKVCLSNFVSEDFLSATKDFFSVLPASLRHGYTTSGQSECVDKVAKTIWVKSRPEIREKNVNKMLTFKGHFFGNGSMLARSLSLENEPYFNVEKLTNPTEMNFQEVLATVEKEFKSGEYLAVWIEPVLQKSMEKIPLEFLRRMRELCTQFGVALVYNETASQFFRYSDKHFIASCVEGITPDAGLLYCSGQSGITFASDQYFLEQPLMLISTWDGDEFHFLSYYHAYKNVMENLSDFHRTVNIFHEKLIAKLSLYEIDSIKIDRGTGHFHGNLSEKMAKMFTRHQGHYIVCPSFDAMKEFIKL